LNPPSSSSSSTGDGDDKDRIVVKLVINVHKDTFEILLNTSSNGIPLHKRGYRQIPTKAPLREDLAYAMLHASGWGDDSNKILFLDPFCGSGTIAIEAASILYNLPPGRLRTTPLLGTSLHDPSLWSSLLNESKVRNHSPQVKIIASDRDRGAISACKQNAMNANVSQYIDFKQASFTDSLESIKELKNTKAFIITNPPYGIRTKKSSNLEMYQKFGFLVNKNNIDKTSSSTVTVVGNTVSTTESGGGGVTISIIGKDRNLIRKTGIANLHTKFITNHGGLKVFVLSNYGDAASES